MCLYQVPRSYSSFKCKNDWQCVYIKFLGVTHHLNVKMIGSMIYQVPRSCSSFKCKNDWQCVYIKFLGVAHHLNVKMTGSVFISSS